MELKCNKAKHQACTLGCIQPQSTLSDPAAVEMEKTPARSKGWKGHGGGFCFSKIEVLNHR